GFLRHAGRDRRGVRTPADECRRANDAPASPPTFAATVHSEANPTDVAADLDRDLFHHLVGGAVRGSALGRAQPTGTRNDHPRQRSRRAGDPGAQAQARLDDDRRGYRVRALVCALHLPADRARRSRRAARHSATLTARRARKKNRAGPTTLLPRRNPTQRYAYASNFVSPIKTAAALRRLVPPTTWTARPITPELACASTPLFGRYPISLGLSPKSNAGGRCEIAPSPCAARHEASAATAPTRPNSWPEGFDSPCFFGGDPVSLGGPEGNDSRPSCASPATFYRSCARPRRRRRLPPTG